MEIFIAGATGAVGRPLVDALVADDHRVISASRHPPTPPLPGRHVGLDLDDDLSAEAVAAMDGAGAAYYLVHAIGDPDFEAIDRRRAGRFAEHWGRGRPLVYLGGLGAPHQGSAHLRSRHEIGALLRAGTDAVELRAALVLAPESISFQLLARLGRLAGLSPLPVLVPTAAAARTQPIGEADLVSCLVRGLEVDPGSYDIGGPEVICYAKLIERSARAQGRRLDVWPLLPVAPGLIGPASALAAGVDPWATTALFAGMGEETVVRPGRELPGAPLATTPLDEAIAAALAPR